MIRSTQDSFKDLAEVFVKYLLLFFIYLFSLTILNSAGAEESAPGRYFRFNYSAEIEAIPADSGPVELFVPLAKSDTAQEIISRKIDISIPGNVVQEPKFGNEFYYAHLDKSDGKPIRINVTYAVRRAAIYRNPVSKSLPDTLSGDELKNAAGFLQADKLIPVSGELVAGIQKLLPKTDGQAPGVRARSIFHYVIQNMENKEAGVGWGKGDFFWATSQKYGNASDFSALFIGLARAEKIPAKFVAGFFIPENADSGEITSDYCWAEFLAPQIGWISVDPFQAKVSPKRTSFYFGALPEDRLQLSVGRDLRLNDAQKAAPLNYFVYPYVEVNGEKFEKMTKKISFSPLPEAERVAAPTVYGAP